MSTIVARMDAFREKVSDPDFSKNKGLGNEIGFHIFDYDPKDEVEVRKRVGYIRDYLNKKDGGESIQIFDLYAIMIHFFEKRSYIEKNGQMEHEKGIDVLFSKMRKALKIASEQDVFVRYIEEHLIESAIVVIIGVGKVFPILRSHILLNNLQSVIEGQPLILCYPGVYEDNSLRLFNEFKDDHYYRAFRMVER
ncbi:DUF1788 domain-containing protein [Carnobacterium gallinarum]|uniref:DUF1788 domain-containing protein n=1 Tax=Carnobacterium gallinarum TaxID=2749 RepID=UPI0005554AD6|nr:DUF1788 domain-containing protein [Carnobacterium gallinarum]